MSQPRAPAPAEDLEDLYEHAPCGYLSLRSDGRIFKVNATFAEWIGHAAEDLIGRHLSDLLNMAGKIFFETHFAPMLRLQGFFNEVALDFLTKTGTRLPVLINAAERRDEKGTHLFTRLTVFNATERRRYERDLVAAREASEKAQRLLEQLHTRANASLVDEQATSALREQFIAVLGHDLRNPLAAIDGGTRLLLKTPLNERAAMIAEMMLKSVGRMAGLIDNVMDFARGRLGQGLTMELEKASPIEDMLRQVAAELDAHSAQHAIEMAFAITAPVTCDTRRVGQLASNLLANALTHGASDAPVRMTAATIDGWFELTVANKGNAIPPNVMARIFEPFSRGDEGRPSKHGLGLGLYIAHEIARAHGGALNVASNDAETRFTFRMPAENSR